MPCAILFLIIVSASVLHHTQSHEENSLVLVELVFVDFRMMKQKTRTSWRNISFTDAASAALAVLFFKQ